MSYLKFVFFFLLSLGAEGRSAVFGETASPVRGKLYRNRRFTVATLQQLYYTIGHIKSNPN